MTDIEARLTDHLRQRADGVEVHDDLDGVLAELATPERHDGGLRRRRAVGWAAAAVVALGVGAIAVTSGRGDPIERPAASTPTVASTVPPTTVSIVPTVSVLPSSATVFPILHGVGETYGSYAVPAHSPQSRMVIGSTLGGGWRDTYSVMALNDPAGDAPPGGEAVTVDGVTVVRDDVSGMALWSWTVGEVGIQVLTAPDSDAPPVAAITARKLSDTEPPQLDVGELPGVQSVLAGPSGDTNDLFPTAATTEGGRATSVEVRDDDLANVLLPGDYEAVDINGAPGRVSTRLDSAGSIVAWTFQEHTVLLRAATSNPDEAIELARQIELVDKATWDTTYQNTGQPPAPTDALEPAPTTVPADVTPIQLMEDMGQADDDQPHAVGCEVITAEAIRVAVATDPYGGPDYEWWTAPTGGGGRSEIVVQVGDRGQTVGGAGGSLGCDPAAPVAIDWHGGSGNGPPNPAVVHGGHVYVEASTVVLTFPGQAPVQVPVNADGYFLEVFPEDPSGAFSAPERIDALDSNGITVATITP